MHKGLPTKPLGVLAAALLCGSVFATGPTVDNPPTVIMTDRMNSADVAASPGAPFDYNTNATQNVYRFTDAFVLADYVDDADDASLSQSSYLFTETDAVGMAQRTGSDRRILIDDSLAWDTSAVPTWGEVDANGAAIPTDALDFRDLFYTTWSTDDQSGVPTSPASGNANFDTATSGGTVTLFDDSSLITVFVVDENSDLDPASASFTVITTNDPQFESDTLSEADNIFEFVECWDDFASWGSLADRGTFFNDNSLNPVGDDFWLNNVNPTLTPTPIALQNDFGGQYDGAAAGTSQLGLSTDVGVASGPAPYNTLFAPQFGFWQSATFAYNTAALVNVTTGNFYMIRAELGSSYADADAADIETVRLRYGSDGTAEIGNATEELNRGINHLEGNIQQRGYFYAHADGELLVGIDVFDLTTDDAGLDLTVDKVEIYRFSRADLGAGTVVIDQGNGGAANFDTTNDWGFANSAAHTGAGSRAPTQGSTSGTQLVIDQTASAAFTSNVFSFWDTAPYAIANTEEIVTAVNGELVVMDVDISSPDGATANNTLPTVRIGFTSSIIYDGLTNTNSQGRSAFFSFDATNAAAGTRPDGSTPINRPLALQTTAQTFTMAVEPQIRGSQTELGLRPNLGALFFDAFPGGFNGDDSGTVVFERVTVTKYQLPDNVGDDFGDSCGNPGGDSIPVR